MKRGAFRSAALNTFTLERRLRSYGYKPTKHVHTTWEANVCWHRFQTDKGDVSISHHAGKWTTRKHS